MSSLKFIIVRESEVPTNTVGSGQIAGTGGTSGEPPRKATRLPILKRRFSDIRNVRK